ncbi:hypothetical protein WN944_000781 [Citrus x changshan-huyou]|uniref:Retrotransposon Copia-like N-terminal domain-containing protein n=1 Tax=Citrus x changshan-huyou TaxID=2935761 RepID=A0AAP0MHZ9_9ROSI
MEDIDAFAPRNENKELEDCVRLITTHKLNSQNFLQWSQFVKLYVKGKGKMGYLDGSIDIPEADDLSYKILNEQNSMYLFKYFLPLDIDSEATNHMTGHVYEEEDWSAKEVDGLYYSKKEPGALSNLSLVDKIVS